MYPQAPQSRLPTHDVINMPPYIGDQDLWLDDSVLREVVQREGGGWASSHLAALGRAVGQAETFYQSELANRYPPELKTFDRYGMRIDQVEFHPAYHALMETAIAHEVHSFAWNHARGGSHVAHGALTYMFQQVEGGVMCPMAMTYSALPSLETTPSVADEWIPRLLSNTYDARDIPVEQKSGATIGMFMTEKQGGSDVRANSTKARPAGAGKGTGAPYRITGHKFFSSAPMCDAFLVLAYTEGGLSCFLVPRWQPNGERNTLYLQRLKEKLGNRSNASSEVEFQDAYGVMVGEEGRGVRTIIDMVQHNRYYCASASAGMMRQGLRQAFHHVTHRTAFQRRLVDQPLMRNVLADLALEVEGAVAYSMRLGRAIDEREQDPMAAAFARIGTAIGKFWVCKRAPAHVGESLECLGGSGYIEENGIARLYREAPLNGIWEGSGNVICLDVHRALQREEAALTAVLDELEQAKGGNPHLDQATIALRDELSDPTDFEVRARSITEQMAVTLQAALLVRHAPTAVSDAFCASRLGDRWSGAYGTLPRGCDLGAILSRVEPA